MDKKSTKKVLLLVVIIILAFLPLKMTYSKAGGFDGGAVCGNGVVQTGEQCDGTNLNGQTCQSLGYASGTLRCYSDCSYDTSSCIPSQTCGNSIVEGTEQCDGNTRTCGNCGTESCTASCTWSGTCSNQGVCSPGSTETQSCGYGGTQSRTCTSSCSWGSWGTCTGGGVCSPGSTETQACGNCGTQSRTCQSNYQWSDWSACTGGGVCSPGSTTDCAGVISTTTGTATCTNSCFWDTSSCAGGNTGPNYPCCNSNSDCGPLESCDPVGGANCGGSLYVCTSICVYPDNLLQDFACGGCSAGYMQQVNPGSPAECPDQYSCSQWACGLQFPCCDAERSFQYNPCAYTSQGLIEYCDYGNDPTGNCPHGSFNALPSTCRQCYVNSCDSSAGSAACTSSTYSSYPYTNHCDLATDQPCGTETSCSDGYDNDCDGLTDTNDAIDCPPPCSNAGGSCTSDNNCCNSSSNYCDLSNSNNKCCPRGQRWNPSAPGGGACESFITCGLSTETGKCCCDIINLAGWLSDSDCREPKTLTSTTPKYEKACVKDTQAGISDYYPTSVSVY